MVSVVMWRKAVLAALMFAALLLLTVGCTKGLIDDQVELIAGGGDTPEVKLTALSPTSPGMLGFVDVYVSPAEGGFDVVVRTTEPSEATDELYFNLQYDATANHAIGLKSEVAESRPGVIGLAVENFPGSIDFGVLEVSSDNLLDAPAEPLVAGDVLLRLVLVLGASDREVSDVASGNRARARNLDMVQDQDGNWVLSWDYTNPGDNNQDGLVSINDLTPIGSNYNSDVSNSWDDPLRHVDANGDGQINMSDITSIGQNYAGEIFAYQIEMWDEVQEQFIVVGQFLMGDQTIAPGETYRFNYMFGAQYTAGGWYRVIPLDKGLEYGSPSEEISEAGRRMDDVQVSFGGKVTVTVSIHDLQNSLTNMNSCRVIYPSNFSYVQDSFNVGSPGGSREEADGIWAGFSPKLLLPPESLLIEADLGDGRKAVDFNVTAVQPDLPGAPVGFGDLFNFQLESSGGEPLALEFQDVCDEGIKRTYYSMGDLSEEFFGNTLGFTVQ